MAPSSWNRRRSCASRPGLGGSVVGAASLQTTAAWSSAASSAAASWSSIGSSSSVASPPVAGGATSGSPRHGREACRAERPEPGQVDEDRLTEGFEPQPGLEVLAIGCAGALVGRAKAFSCVGGGPFGFRQSISLRGIRGVQLGEGFASRGLGRDRCGQLTAQALTLGGQRLRALVERRDLAVRSGDALLAEADRGFGPRPAALGVATRGIPDARVLRQTVTARSQFGRAGLPRLDGTRVRCRTAGRRSRLGGGDRRFQGIERGRRAIGISLQPLRLRRGPRRLAEDRLEVAGRQSLAFLGRPAKPGCPCLIGPCRLKGRASRAGGRRCRRRLRRGRCDDLLGAFDGGRESGRLGSTFQDGLWCAQPDAQLVDDGRPVPGDDDPAWRQRRLDGQASRQIRHPRRSGENTSRDTTPISTERVREESPTAAGQRVAEPTLACVRRGAGHGATDRRGRPLLDDQGPALVGKRRHRVSTDHVGADRLRQGGLDRRPERRVDDKIVIEAPAAQLLRGLRDPATLLFRESAREVRASRIEPGVRRPGGGQPGLGRGPLRLGCLQRGPCGLASGDGPFLCLDRGRARGPGGLERRLTLVSATHRGRGTLRLVGRLARGLGPAPTGGLQLGLARGRRSTDRGELLALRSVRGAQGRELGKGVGRCAFRFGQGGFGREVSRGDGRRRRAAPGRHLGLGRDALVVEPLPVAVDRFELGGEAGIAELGAGQCRSCGIVGLASRPLGLGACAELGRQCGRGGLGSLHLGHGPVRLGSRRRLACPRGGHPPGGFVPSGMGRQEDGPGELVGSRLAAGLLLGLGGEASRLRPQLGDDVLDPREIGLRLRELLLGAAPATLVTADAGDFLEQRPPLLRAQGQRLVDHALPDEQEGVVGKVRGVEEVDEVAEPDALLVQEVVVLARSVQAPPQLQHRELDREQAVGVVDDQCDVRHALGRPLLRSRPDHVLGLARPEGLALLAERPAERVREIALARSVGPDDRADPAAELHVGPLGERLEPLEAQGEQSRRRRTRGAARAVAVAHAPTASGRCVARR